VQDENEQRTHETVAVFQDATRKRVQEKKRQERLQLLEKRKECAEAEVLRRQMRDEYASQARQRRKHEKELRKQTEARLSKLERKAVRHQVAAAQEMDSKMMRYLQEKQLLPERARGLASFEINAGVDTATDARAPNRASRHQVHQPSPGRPPKHHAREACASGNLAGHATGCHTRMDVHVANVRNNVDDDAHGCSSGYEAAALDAAALDPPPKATDHHYSIDFPSDFPSGPPALKQQHQKEQQQWRPDQGRGFRKLAHELEPKENSSVDGSGSPRTCRSSRSTNTQSSSRSGSSRKKPVWQRRCIPLKPLSAYDGTTRSGYLPPPPTDTSASHLKQNLKENRISTSTSEPLSQHQAIENIDSRLERGREKAAHVRERARRLQLEQLYADAGI